MRSPPTLADQALGRAVLRDIRQTISEFRDGEREHLVRARNQLAWTGTITIVTGVWSDGFGHAQSGTT